VNTRIRTAFAAITLALLATSASAQREFHTPSDNELHSSYCQAVLKAQIDWIQPELAKADAYADTEHKPPLSPELQHFKAKQRAEMHAMLAKLQSAQDRINAYLMPRLTSLEPTAMLAALRRAEADWREFQAITDRCGKKCNAIAAADQIGACWTSCTDDALIARINACAEPNWLPF
jgi:hypothetical protein